jgi:hypothetical protein
MIPGYYYFVIHKDLYTVYGGEILCPLTRGTFTFSNELMTSCYLTKKNTAGRWDNDEFNEFDKYLLFGDGYVEWKAFNHPQFGDIEIEGLKELHSESSGVHDSGRCAQKHGVSLYHAYQTQN